jgi:S-formylglutathione hydrolase FrmB
MKALMVLTIALLITACAAPAVGSPSRSQGPPSTATALTPSSTPTISPAPTPAPTATKVPTIGQAADDGARIISVTVVDARIRDLLIDSPAVGVAGVRILVPRQFDAQPTKRWPVLYLLHGATGQHLNWTQSSDVEAFTQATDLLVVMPDGGEKGWYSDWWNGGRGGAPMWETFHLDELAQLLERNWHAGKRRVIAGLSMGGYGAMEYAARRPGMFLAAASYSGAVDPLGGGLDIGTQDLWGSPVAQAEVWKAHDPVNLAAALKGTALYISYGDGTPGPLDQAGASRDDLETWIAGLNKTFVARLRELKIPATVEAYGPGTHDWPYWQRALHRSMPLLLKALGG